MLEILETPVTVLHIVVCLFVVLIVLLQPGKSGGIGAALGGAGAQQVFGGRGAGNFLSRLTWIAAGIFFATSMILAYVSSSSDDSLADQTGRAVVTPVEKKAPPGDEAPAAPAEDENAAGAPAEENAESSDEGAEDTAAAGAPGKAPRGEGTGEPSATDPAPTPADEKPAVPKSPARKPPAVPKAPGASPAEQPATPPAAPPPAVPPPPAAPAPAAPSPSN